MKIRSGFVTNSSSTCFYITFDGKIMSIVKSLLKHSDIFTNIECKYHTDSINVDDLCDAIVKNMVPNDIDTVIQNVKEHVNQMESMKDYHRYYGVYIDKLNGAIDRLETAKNAGARYVIKLSFGDNCGNITDVVGSAMYNNSYIDINDGSFQMFSIS